MKPNRQIESVELMISANSLTVEYARSLLAGTPPEWLVKPKTRHKSVTLEQARMQREMTNLQDQYKIAEQTYGEDTLNLVLARGYVMKLIDNKLVCRYLEQHEPAVLEQFVEIIKTATSEI